MNKISEVLRLRYELNRSYKEIAHSLNISKSTVSEYLNRAKVAKLSWPLLQDLSEHSLREKLYFTNNIDKTIRPLPNWDDIFQELRRKGVTLRLLWHEYKEKYPNGLGYTQFCKRYRDYVKKISPVMKQVHKAGEKTFVDYAGMTLPWLDSITGEIHEAQIFVGSLGASQYTFVEATASQQVHDWIGSHIRMWSYFGGVSKITVPDNLKSGVSRAHRYDPDINKNYQHVGEHYNFAIVPARPGAPKDKAKVENAVGCIERQILALLRDRTFVSIAEINQAIQPLLEKFNAQKFQKMDTSRKQLFEEVDKPSLQALPQYAYEYATWKKAKVNIDYHVVFEHHYYSVPYKLIHQDIEIRATSKTIECFYQSKRVALHKRSLQKYQHTTIKEHMPKSHQEQGKWTPKRLLHWAANIGANTEAFIHKMIVSKPFPEQSFRSCLGLLRLSKGYGEQRLEAACKKGLEVGAYRYQHIESILKNRLDNTQATQSEHPPIINVHKNIRGSNYYQ